MARKVLVHAWKHDLFVEESRLYKVNTLKYFNVAVEACLLILKIGHTRLSKICHCFESLSDPQRIGTVGYSDGKAIADVINYQQLRHLYGIDKNYVWRSGLKHDCAKVMELTKHSQGYENGYSETVYLEDTYIYPLLKSSDIGNGYVLDCRKYLLVTQRYISEDTSPIQNNAPKTWNYLQNHAEALFKRKSFVYKERPPFSIFGVGHYTFYPWKIAISGFYKKIDFKLVRPIGNKPVVFDDTVYFLPFWLEQEAQFILELLNSNVATLFLKSMIFWSDKRPITIDVLKRLNIQMLARELSREDEYSFYVKQRINAQNSQLVDTNNS